MDIKVDIINNKKVYLSILSLIGISISSFSGYEVGSRILEEQEYLK